MPFRTLPKVVSITPSQFAVKGQATLSFAVICTKKMRGGQGRVVHHTITPPPPPSLPDIYLKKRRRRRRFLGIKMTRIVKLICSGMSPLSLFFLQAIYHVGFHGSNTTLRNAANVAVTRGEQCTECRNTSSDTPSTAIEYWATPMEEVHRI